MQKEPRTKDFYCLVRITSNSHLLYEREGCGISLAGTHPATKLANGFATPPKVTASGHPPSCCICWNSSSAFCPCPHFTCSKTMVVQETTSYDDISFNTLRAYSMLPHFAYMSTQLFTTKTSEYHPLSMISLCTCPPQVQLCWHIHLTPPQK